MKKGTLIFILVSWIALASMAQSPSNWDSYSLNVLSFYDNSGGSRDLDRQDLIFNFDSEVGTTELLIVSASNGNSNTMNKPTLIYDGGWGEITVYGGNDDKSVEVWMRQVHAGNVDDPGDVDARGAYADFAILVYPGLLKSGLVSGKILGGIKPSITNQGAAPWLVVATTDNGNNHDVPGTTLANAEFYSKKDDRVFVYLTNEKSFSDPSSFNVRGSICSIEIIEEEATEVDCPNLSESTLSIFPNPTSDGSIHFEMHSEIENISTLEIIGMDGRLAYSDDWSLSQGLNRRSLQLTQRLRKGSYMVRVVSSEKAVSSTMVHL